jgi:hypothetical protein
MASGGLPTQHNVTALEWLAEKHQEAARLAAASQAEQIEIARSAKDAAWAAARAAEKANRRATAALMLAAISIVATIILGLVSHSDTTKPVTPVVPAPVQGDAKHPS